MAVVAAVVSAVGSAAAGAASAIAGAASAVAAGVAGAAAAAPLTAAGLGVGAYSTIKGAQEAEKAREQMKKQAATAAVQKQQELEFMEKQAGEYYGITRQQMELQAQQSNIKTLVDVISSQKSQPAAPPQVLTLPAAKTYTPIERINQAIGNLLRAA